MQEETGGFGGLLLTTHQWTATDKLLWSYELFARCVIPHFRGHTRGYRDEWRRIQQTVKDGGIIPESATRPGDVASKQWSEVIKSQAQWPLQASLIVRGMCRIRNEVRGKVNRAAA